MSNQSKGKTDVNTIVKAIEKQIDSETLNVTKSSSLQETVVAKVSELNIEDKIVKAQDVDFKPTSEPQLQIAKKHHLAMPLARFPLKPITRPQVSTFYPTTQNLFEVVHYMDTIMSEDAHFLNTGLPWHPFLSSLYFGILVYYQTLRCMLHTRQGNRTTRQWAEQLIKDIPPERLAVPGPLMPIFKSISASQPTDTSYGIVTPIIPDIIGSATADEPTMVNHTFCLPNIPFIIGLNNTLIQPDIDNIPDYSDPASFTPGHTPDINGIHFPDHWTIDERILLSKPGVIHRPIVSQDILETYNSYGPNYHMPVLNDEYPTAEIPDFLCLDEHTWFENILPTMNVYCTYFKEPGTLGDCSPFGPPTGLVSTRLTTLTSANAAQNQINQMTSAFPGTFPFKYIYDSRSYELSIPQPYQLMAQFAAINSRIDYTGMAPIFTNTPNTTRRGPYWDSNPTNLRQSNCTAFSCIEEIVLDYYYQPKQ